MASRFQLPFADVGSGITPSSGAKLFFFATDGVTPQDTFTTSGATVANTNPVISDAKGVFSDIFIIGEYKVTLKDKNDSQIFGGVLVDEYALSKNLPLSIQAYTLAEAKALDTAVIGQIVQITDRDNAQFEYITATTNNTFNLIDATGSSLTLSLIINDALHVKHFGAVGDGVTDDTLPIQECLNQSYTDGLEVLIPDGIFIVSASSESDIWAKFPSGTRLSSEACLIVKGQSKLVGLNSTSSIIKTLDTNLSLIFAGDINNGGVSNLRLEGPDSSAGGGAGIFNVVTDLDNDVVNYSLENLFVTGFGGYGIGINEGHLRNLYVNNIETFDTGSDGIDIKSRAPDLSIDEGNKVSNFTARKFGVRVTGSVGIDIRGVVNISNIFAREFGAVGVAPWFGVRLRPASEANNIAQLCNVVNLIIDCNGHADANGLSYQGVNCNVSNVTVNKPVTGVQYAGSTGSAIANTLTNVVVTGASSESYKSTVSGDDIVVSNFISVDVNGAARHFRIEGQGNTFCNSYGDSSATEYSVAAAAVDSFTRNGGNASYTDTLDTNEIIAGRAGLTARGPSTDIDIALTPKGIGKVRFGSHSAVAAEVVTGYITIKDDTGASRKVAIIS